MNGSFANFLIVAVVLYAFLKFAYPRLKRMARGKDVAYLPVETLAKQMAEKRDMLLIDIRTPQEFYNMFGHIDTAINLPFETFAVRLNETADRLVGFKQTPVVVIGLRDENAVFKAYKLLKRKGFEHAAILDNGVSQWLRRGFPTVERNVRKY